MRNYVEQGYCCIDGQIMRDILKQFGATDDDLDAYASHWNGLGDDPTYDFRKTSQTRWNHAEDFTRVARLERSSFRIPDGVDKNGKKYKENAVLGKLERWFPEPTPEFVDSTVHIASVKFIRYFLKVTASMDDLNETEDNLGYMSGSHQFRIEVKPLSLIQKACKKVSTSLGMFGMIVGVLGMAIAKLGMTTLGMLLVTISVVLCTFGMVQAKKKTIDDSPTPEGVHQDGAWVVMIMYINSCNMGHRSGESRIYNENQATGTLDRDASAVARKTTRLAERNLATPFETFLLNDRVVKHDNKKIIPADDQQYAFRDVHVIWAREFNPDDKEDPRGVHPSHPVEITSFNDM